MTQSASQEDSFLTEQGAAGDYEALSLLRRSKRVLRHIDLKEAPIPTTSESPASESAAPSKRREQVLKAQRTHRQRTQTYMKELEKEVLRLRNCESDALARVDRLQLQVTTLLHTLAEYKIPAPPGIVDEVPFHQTDSMGQVVLSSQEDPGAALVHISFPSVASHSSVLASENAENKVSTPTSGSSVLATATTFPPMPGCEQAMGHRVTQQILLQDPRVGIDFVLALERICLPHLRMSHLDYDDQDEFPSIHGTKTSLHLFTASLTLWRPSHSSRSAQESYEISATQIERLLNNSLNIGVKDDEITPVQIWNHLKHFEFPGKKQRESLERLTAELCKHVECLHFGAVISLRRFNHILSEFLPEAVMTA